MHACCSECLRACCATQACDQKQKQWLWPRRATRAQRKESEEEIECIDLLTQDTAPADKANPLHATVFDCLLT